MSYAKQGRSVIDGARTVSRSQASGDKVESNALDNSRQ